MVSARRFSIRTAFLRRAIRSAPWTPNFALLARMSNQKLEFLSNGLNPGLEVLVFDESMSPCAFEALLSMA